MIRLLDRLVLATFLKLFVAFAVVGAPLLFIIGDLTERIDRYMDRGVTGLELALGYVLQLPMFIMWSFPIAGLVAAVFTVHAMTVHSEVVAAKAGGVSFHRLFAPILVMGVILTGVGLGLTELVPRANRQAAVVMKERETRREWRSNFVYQSEDGRTVTVQRLTVADGRLARVVLEAESPTGDGVATHLIAEEALFHPERGWTFRNGFLRHFLADGSERAYRFEEYRTRWFTEHPEELLEDPRDDEEMTYAELGRLAEIIRRSGGDPSELLVKKEEKLSIPVATLVVILFGMPLATSAKRGGASFGIGISLASTILYMVLMRVTGAMGDSGAIPPLAAAWLPNVLFLVTGVGLLTRVRT